MLLQCRYNSNIGIYLKLHKVIFSKTEGIMSGPKGPKKVLFHMIKTRCDLQNF